GRAREAAVALAVRGALPADVLRSLGLTHGAEADDVATQARLAVGVARARGVRLAAAGRRARAHRSAVEAILAFCTDRAGAPLLRRMPRRARAVVAGEARPTLVAVAAGLADAAAETAGVDVAA